MIFPTKSENSLFSSNEEKVKLRLNLNTLVNMSHPWFMFISHQCVLIQPIIVDISLNFMENVVKKFLSLKSMGEYLKYVWLFIDESNQSIPDVT